MTDNQDRMAQALLAAKAEFDFLVQKRTFDVTDRERWRALANVIQAAIAHASAQPAQPASVADGWIDGEPPHPWNKEWFIAVTTDGDRVVLRALPKEYTYDYTTADATYLKAAKIKKWMQFPDSEFVPAPQPPSAMAQDAQDGGVTNEMVLRAVHASLDWPHPLTHFEARKALEAAMAQESGE